jgi:23S rRNA pseudouridine1911/1915/1917 synthase
MIGKTRLHKAVIEYLKDKPELDYTNPEVQRNIESFGVLVDGQLVKNRLQWFFPGQSISIPEWTNREHGNFDEVQILEDTDDYLLLFKPVGIVVQPGAGHQSQNLQKWLENKYNKELFLVHRLDKDTQGLLLVAKSQSALDFFQNQFRNRSTTKKYLAIVEKVVDNLWIIENWQTRDKTNPTKQKLFWTELEAMAYDPSYRYAHSILKPLFYSKHLDQTLVEIEIKTGRMHQIRLQCEAIGCPLVQEKVYNSHRKAPDNIDTLTVLPVEKAVDLLSVDAFGEIKTRVFGETDYCLLSNYLKLQKPNGEWLEVEYKKIED